MFDRTARQTILDWEQKQTQNQEQQTLKLLQTDHGEQTAFESFGNNLSALATSIRVTPTDRKNLLPGFLLKENITYSALPLERELSPFLAGLSCIQTREPKPSPSIQTLLENIRIPCHLTLYIAMMCPHCPAVVNTVLPLAVFSEKINLEIIDGTLFPETAQTAKVLSAPCLILDDGFRWTGSVTAEELLSMITQRDVSKLSPQTLRTILEKGEALWICQEMIRAGIIFKGFVMLLQHELWSVRLGAMVVVETLAEERPELALKLCPLLIRAFDRCAIPVQGDLLYALGETGDMDTRTWIQTILEHLENEELKEAAEDAIESIESRHWPSS
jgi:glutaredoxin